MLHVYGIPNCDTVKKALVWLREHKVEFTFHDFKQLNVGLDRLDRWTRAVGWEVLLNRKGTSWRKLDEALRNTVVNAATAHQIMRAHPSTIKRPVVEWPDGTITVGFDEARYAELVER